MKIAVSTAAVVLSASLAMAEGKSDDTVHWNLVATVNPGMQEQVVPLVTRMSEATMENESGARIYEYMQSGDTIHIYERYADSASALVHMGNFGENFAKDFLATFSIQSISLYGPAEDDLKAVLDGLPVTYYDKIAGFAR